MNNPYQHVISAQVWVCDACGCQDNKSCGCDSTAHAEEMAAKRELKRQGDRAYREEKKTNKINERENLASIDNVEEFPRSPADDARRLSRAKDASERRDAHIISDNNYNSFLMNCHASAASAAYSGRIDDKAIAACRMVAKAWSDLLQKMESQYA